MFPLPLLSALITTRVATSLAYATPSLLLLLKIPVQKGTLSAGIAAQVVVSKLVGAFDSLTCLLVPSPNWLTDTHHGMLQ